MNPLPLPLLGTFTPQRKPPLYIIHSAMAPEVAFSYACALRDAFHPASSFAPSLPFQLASSLAAPRGMIHMDDFDPFMPLPGIIGGGGGGFEGRGGMWGRGSGSLGILPPLAMVFIVTPGEAKVLVQGWLSLVGGGGGRDDTPPPPPLGTAFALYCINDGGSGSGDEDHHITVGEEVEHYLTLHGATPMIPSTTVWMGGGGRRGFSDVSFNRWMHTLLDTLADKHEQWERSRGGGDVINSNSPFSKATTSNPLSSIPPPHLLLPSPPPPKKVFSSSLLPFTPPQARRLVGGGGEDPIPSNVLSLVEAMASQNPLSAHLHSSAADGGDPMAAAYLPFKPQPPNLPRSSYPVAPNFVMDVIRPPLASTSSPAPATAAATSPTNPLNNIPPHLRPKWKEDPLLAFRAQSTNPLFRHPL